MNPFDPIQAAIYSKLTPALAGLAAVYDEYPAKDTAAFPYVIIGEASSRAWRTASRHGEEVFCTIHTFSRYQGNAEANAIMAVIDEEMAYQPLNLEGYMLVGCYFDDRRIMRDPDGLTRHGVVTYRLQVLKGG